MTDNVYPLLMVPQDVMRACAARVRELRIGQNVTQKELAERVGVAEAVTDNPMRLLMTTASTVYVTMRITNNSKASLIITAGNNSKFTLVCGISGTVVDARGTHSISRTITTAAIYRPTTNQTVPVGGSVDLIYQITNIWSEDGTTDPQHIESGTLTLSPTLKLGGTDAYPLSGGLLGITC